MLCIPRLLTKHPHLRKELSPAGNNYRRLKMPDNKDKIVSFRVSEDTFETLSDIGEERDASLSEMFREYVDMLVKHNGDVELVPEGRTPDDGEFPPKVKVPKQVLREQERLELENEHLREQIQEHKEYINTLKDRLEDDEDVEHVMLGNVDAEYR